MHTVYTLQQLEIHTQEHKNRSPTGRGTLTNTLQHINCRSPDTNITTVTYADDTTILSTHTDPHIAQQQVQPYLQEIYNWTKQIQLTHNASMRKTATTLFTPDPEEYNKYNTYTTNQQLHITHKQRAKNPRTHTRPETNL